MVSTRKSRVSLRAIDCLSGEWRFSRVALAVALVVSPSCRGQLEDETSECGAAYTDAGLDADLGLVWVPSGTFLMGSPTEEVSRETDAAGYVADETQHSVTLTRDFVIGSTEVTQGQYEAYMDRNPSSNTGCGAECPVENVNWYDAAAFANAVSDAAGFDPCYLNCVDGSENDCQPLGSPYDCEGYRIPTESEWEYAVRAGEVAAFPSGGNLVLGDEHNCDGSLVLDNGSVLDDAAWYCGIDEFVTQPVASLEPNAWGLYDTGGNLWEWVYDHFDDYDGDQTDPVGPDWNGDPVMRGGCWAHLPGGVRSAFRLYGKGAGYRSNNSGFRLARTSP
jgi:formylglycine-generating enzyme required for sulfatase activity